MWVILIYNQATGVNSSSNGVAIDNKGNVAKLTHINTQMQGILVKSSYYVNAHLVPMQFSLLIKLQQVLTDQDNVR